MAYLFTYPLISYSTIYEWSRDLALLCMCVCKIPWYILDVSVDMISRSWWIGLLSGSEQLNPVVWLGAGGACWACPASTYGGYKCFPSGNRSFRVREGLEETFGGVIPVMGANHGPLRMEMHRRWRRSLRQVRTELAGPSDGTILNVHTSYPIFRGEWVLAPSGWNMLIWRCE